MSLLTTTKPTTTTTLFDPEVAEAAAAAVKRMGLGSTKGKRERQKSGSGGVRIGSRHTHSTHLQSTVQVTSNDVVSASHTPLLLAAARRGREASQVKKHGFPFPKPS